MELYQTAVDAVARKLLPVSHVSIVCLGDIHFGSPRCDVKKLKEDIGRALDENSYFLGMGDYMDFASPSNRGRLTGLIAEGRLFDSVEDALTNAAEETIAELASILRPTADRWLGMLEGHHFWIFEDGTTSTQRLAGRLGSPYLGRCAYVLLEFRPERGVGHVSPGRVAIWCHHGHGGGTLASAPINKLERLIRAFDADIYVIGHMHRLATARIQRLTPEWGTPHGKPKLRQRDLILGCTGSYLRGYMEGDRKGSYAEQKMLLPYALGNLRIQLRPRVVHGGRVTVEATA